MQVDEMPKHQLNDVGIFSSMGHETVLATLTLFGRRKNDGSDIDGTTLKFDDEYLFIDNIDEKSDDADAKNDVKELLIFALLEFEKPVVISPKSSGTKL
jgi:hypothetical protein